LPAQLQVKKTKTNSPENKMKNIKKTTLIAVGCLSFLAFTQANAQIVITEWKFDNLSAATNLTPAPSTGSGTATSMGMALFTGPDISDVTVAQGTDSDNSGASNQAWRVRGSNGWNSGAAIGTQGAQFNADTTGFTGINLTFDVQITAQGEANLQVEYTTDGSTWQNAGLTYAGAGGSILTNSSNSNIVTGSYFHGNATVNDTWFNGITANLSGVSAANNDANFGIRIVNAATGSSDVNLKTNGALNNTSGNWRFDDVTISGAAAVPEPGTCALMFAGFITLLGFQVCRRNKIA
jgi:hypothetical protein